MNAHHPRSPVSNVKSPVVSSHSKLNQKFPPHQMTSRNQSIDRVQLLCSKLETNNSPISHAAQPSRPSCDHLTTTTSPNSKRRLGSNSYHARISSALDRNHHKEAAKALVNDHSYSGDLSIRNLNNILIFHKKYRHLKAKQESMERHKLLKRIEKDREALQYSSAVKNVAGHDDEEVDHVLLENIPFHLLDAPLLRSVNSTIYDDWLSSPIIVDAIDSDNDSMPEEISRLFSNTSESSQLGDIKPYFNSGLRLILILHKELRCPQDEHERFWYAHQSIKSGNLITLISRLAALSKSRDVLMRILRIACLRPSPDDIQRIRLYQHLKDANNTGATANSNAINCDENARVASILLDDTTPLSALKLSRINASVSPSPSRSKGDKSAQIRQSAMQTIIFARKSPIGESCKDHNDFKVFPVKDVLSSPIGHKIVTAGQAMERMQISEIGEEVKEDEDDDRNGACNTARSTVDPTTSVIGEDRFKSCDGQIESSPASADNIRTAMVVASNDHDLIHHDEYLKNLAWRWTLDLPWKVQKIIIAGSDLLEKSRII